MAHTNTSRFGRFAAASVAALLLSSGTVLADEPPYVERQALVRLAAGETVEAFNARYGTATLERIDSRRTYLVSLPVAGDEPEFVDLVRNDPRVQRADLNYIASNTDGGGTGQSIFLFRTAAQFWQDQAYVAADATDASNVAPNAQLGAGVLVAVIDTGVDATHPHLAGRVDPRGYDFILRQNSALDVGDGVDNDLDGRTDNYVGHGTAVAGIILRVAPNASILPVRAMNSDGVANIFAVTEGVYYAIDRGARVINISIGTYGDPTILREALLEAQAAGVSVVAAAGNDSVSSPVFMPAGMSGTGVIAVTAVDNALARASFANFGEWVSLSAPGELVVSTLPGAGYGAASGTSFAAPFVAGAIALVRSECTTITPGQAAARLAASASNIDTLNPNYDSELGAGAVRAAAAAGSARGLGGCACPADADRNGSIEPGDLFVFLNRWFLLDPLADIDKNGAVMPSDIFEFLGLWFTRCS